MGQVYLALDTVLCRHVTVKFVAGSAIPDAATRQRFLVEARAAARLQHPNVVGVYRVGELELRPYLVAEFVRGQTLDALPKPVPWARALEIGIDLARGLAAAHRKGVLHRDIKAANAMIAEDGAVKLLDFGLAAFVEDGERKAEAAVVGTPDNMAPEVWRAEAATRASDVYSLGTVLYELVTGNAPFHDVPEERLALAVTTTEARPLAEAAPGVHPRLAEIVDRCLRRDPAARYPSGDALRDALDDLARQTAVGASAPEGNPYRGLRAFEADHRALFFGRSVEIGVVVDRLRTEPFLLVAGESGVGKSSLCKAGVVPSVCEGGLADGRTWSSVAMVPGRRPLAALAGALAQPLETSEEALAQELRADPAALPGRLSRRLGDQHGLLLFVDQLEELITIADAEEAALVDTILAHLSGGMRGFRLLGTVRGDFVTRLAALPGLGDELGRTLYVLRPLTPEKTREVIVGPARLAGTRFESEALVTTLIQSTAQGDSLPLLQFALAELWETRDKETGTITVAALEAMGGVGGALARHADHVLAGLLPTQRASARRVMLRLVSAEGTRARKNEHELVGDSRSARGALDALVRGRLLVAQESDGGAAYEVAHESLLQGWATLRQWLVEDADLRLVRERVSHAAGEWRRLRRSRDAVWNARQLAEADRLDKSELLPEERAFLAASWRATGRARWIRRGIAAGVLAAIAGVYGFVSWRARAQIDARVAARLAEARPLLDGARAQDAAMDLLRRHAFALFDARLRDEGEAIWSRVLSGQHEVERTYAHASRALEAALAQDGERDDVRALLADTLLARALIAHDPDRRDELVERLALYDRSGERMRRWNAPATLSAAGEPGIEVAIEGGAALGAVPLQVELAHGSYVLLLSAPGRVPARLPILLGRGESLAVSLALPAAVPDGYVYVPPGRFLFGTGADEGSRRGFFDAHPIHEVSTGGYLIARREVTFGEWVAFLETLPPAERAQRLPRNGQSVNGAFELRREPAGWRLTLDAGSALAGESMRFPGRDRRIEQDWRRFPVTGISAEDAEAYAAWLAKTGRVPGARLCSELEWERAARGADGRELPHGSSFASDDANIDETYGKKPDAMGPDEVGSHPASRSPFGVDDLAGNAFEWTTSSFAAGDYVVRGGSYFHDQKTAQTVNRTVSVPTLRDSTLGVRLCADHGSR